MLLFPMREDINKGDGNDLPSSYLQALNSACCFGSFPCSSSTSSFSTSSYISSSSSPLKKSLSNLLLTPSISEVDPVSSSPLLCSYYHSRFKFSDLDISKINDFRPVNPRHPRSTENIFFTKYKSWEHKLFPGELYSRFAASGGRFGESFFC